MNQVKLRSAKECNKIPLNILIEINLKIYHLHLPTTERTIYIWINNKQFRENHVLGKHLMRKCFSEFNILIAFPGKFNIL